MCHPERSEAESKFAEARAVTEFIEKTVRGMHYEILLCIDALWERREPQQTKESRVAA